MAVQNLYISTIKARHALTSKSELECFAFAVMCKIMFGSSVIRKRTAREFKELFGMGYTRFSRIFRNSLSKGYLTDMGGYYMVAPVKDSKAYNFPIQMNVSFGGGRTKINLNKVKDEIRKVAEYNNLSIKETIADANVKANNPKNLREYRRARKVVMRAVSQPRLTEKFSGDLRGTSMSKIARTMSCSKRKARRLIGDMIYQGLIDCTPKTIETDFLPEQFTARWLDLLKEMGWYGSYFRLGDKVCCRVMNIYEIKGLNRLKYLR